MTKLPVFLQGNTDELIVYLCGGYYQSGYISGPGPAWIFTLSRWWLGQRGIQIQDFLDNRDLELCKRLNAQLKHSVYAPSFKIGSTYDPALGFYRPLNWLQKNIYDFATSRGFKKIHLIGFSAGGCAISSQFLYYPDSKVQDIVIISGWTANNPKAVHTNAAYYSDKIKIPTLLIYGKQDSFRPNADVWLQHNSAAKLIEYDGGHDYGPAIDLVTRSIVSFLGSPSPTVRKIHLNMKIGGLPSFTVTLTEGVKQTVQVDITGTIEG